MTQSLRTITQHGNLQFTSDDLSPMEIARRLATVGVYVTDISVFAPLQNRDEREADF